MNPETNTPGITILRKAGLTESQAKGYLALIEHGDLSPAELAEKTGESRTNGYMICEKLEQLGLATKKDGQKAIYSANHPSNVELLAEKRRKVLMRNEEDRLRLLDRQFMPNELYTAPVEMDIYGNRVSFIAYGETLTGIIIDNKHIADAMRQLFMLARTGAEVEMQKRPDLMNRLHHEREQHEKKRGSNSSGSPVEATKSR